MPIIPPDIQTDDSKWRRDPTVSMKSPAMRALFTQTCRLAGEGKACVMAIPSADRFEIRSFFQRVAGSHGQTEHVRIITANDPPASDELEEDNRTSLLILNGENLPEHLQWTIVENRMNFPFILLAVKPYGNPREARRGWIPIFRDACGPETLVWPGWRERQDDHADVLDELIRRIRLPDGAPAPVLDATARDLLLSYEFEDLGHLRRVVHQAVQYYLTAGSPSGRLEAKHFATRQKMRLLSSHRGLPALPIVK